MRMLVGLVTSFGMLLSFPTLASSQTQSQFDRLDELALFTVTVPMCRKLGFQIAPDFEQRIDPAIDAEISGLGGDTQRLRTAAKQAVAHQSQVFGVDLKSYSDGARTDQDLRNVKQIFARYGVICQRAARDSFFSSFVTMPVGFDLDKATTATADELLEGGGLASWQTPLITARGDMMMLAGACRHRIGPNRSDQLQAFYGRADDPRERDYYRKSFDAGMNDPDLTAFTRQQCLRAIGNYERKIATLGYRIPTKDKPK